ncbi:hypothetical protein CSX04_03237 [Burkholderia cepacia]|nr:hypothetical protein CSX04_03237 [Burkholderia cepacia]
MFASLALVVLAVGIDPKPFTDAIDPTVGRLIQDASHSKLPAGDSPAQPQRRTWHRRAADRGTSRERGSSHGGTAVAYTSISVRRR